MVLGAASGVQTLSVKRNSDHSLSLIGASSIAPGGLLYVANPGSQVSGNMLTNFGAISLDNSAFLSVGLLKNNGAMTVTGTITGILENTGTMTFTGANPSTLVIGASANTNSGTITVNKSLNINMPMGSIFTNSGTIDTGAGNSVTLNGTGVYGSFTNSGIITGTGTVDVSTITSGTFSNAGAIKPATPGTSGLLSFTGMSMTGTDVFYIDISGAATNDQVEVGGTTAISGTLNLALNGYDPPAGDSFTILTCGTACSGTFVTTNLPPLTGGKSWNVAYNPASVVLSVVPPVMQSQTIGVISFLPSTLAVGGSSTVSATGGGSGNPVTFASATPLVCTVSGANGSSILPVSTGTCTIVANQAGNAVYYVASPVSGNLTVNPLPANQVITGADGITTVPVSLTAPGANVTLASGTLLKDAAGNPISGTLTVTASVMNSTAALPGGLATAQTSDGKVLSALGNSIDIIISAGASTVKTIAPPMIVNLAISSAFALPGATVSYYSFDGVKWTLEGSAIVKSDGTVDIAVSHLSVWAVAVFLPTIDAAAPDITSFTVPATSSTLTVSGIVIAATDAVGVTGYLMSESATPPLASDPAWTPGAPASFTLPTWGNHTLYAYAKDAAGNIAKPKSATILIGSTDGVIAPAPATDPPKLEPQLSDALKSLNFAMKIETPTQTELLHGDVAPLVNGLPEPDGEINLGDTIVTLRRVVGL